MAKLKSDNLTLEIKFNKFETDWIAYEIIFLWKDETIINDSIIKKRKNHKNYGTFYANDYEDDSLIEMIKKVIESNKPDYWEPMEPDAKIAIYPERYFPFLMDHWIPVEDSNEKIIRTIDEKPNNNKYELFTVITFIDRYNFKECNSYSSEGISLHLIVTRKDLETLVSDLEIEYNELLNKIKDKSK